LLQEAITLKPNESEETDRTTEEMEGRTAKTKVIIKRSQDSGSGSRKESGRLNKVVEHAESRTSVSDLQSKSLFHCLEGFPAFVLVSAFLLFVRDFFRSFVLV
jgi:hypothetical protein